MTSTKKKKQERLQIAIEKESGEWVSIYSVPSGRSCNCKCPDTGLDLEAKNRNKRPDIPLSPGQKMAHFAIARAQDYEGQPNLETAIHKLAKEVFKENKKIALPEIICEEVTLAEPMIEEFDCVNIEDTTQLSEFGFKPDAVGLKKTKKEASKKLFVEFMKTHAVDDNKTEKIKGCKISCVEIDLNGISQLDKYYKPNKSGIQSRLENPDFATWIYNVEEEVLRKELIERIEKQGQEELDRQEKEEEENWRKGRKRKGAEYNKLRKELAEASIRRKQRTKGLGCKQIAEYIEREKIQIELSLMPKYCKLYEVNQYVNCPKYPGSHDKCTLHDCFYCSFFYKIKTVPKTSCNFVICCF